jgi:hypothetical protein
VKRAILLLLWLIVIVVVSWAATRRFEDHFSWYQDTWDGQQHCFAAQPKGSGQYVGACAASEDEAKREVLKKANGK